MIFSKKIACGAHSGSLFRFAEPAPIGRSPAKRKNAREPAFVRSGFIFHVCGGQNIFVCFINSFLFAKRFFRAFGPKFSAGRVYQMLAAGGNFLRFRYFLKENAYHFGGVNRSLNYGKRCERGRKRCKKKNPARLTAPESV